MKILNAQLDSRLGDMRGNIEHALEIIEYVGSTEGAPDLVVLPPFYLTGCPLEGMIYSDSFLRAVAAAHGEFAEELASRYPEMAAVTVSYITEFDDELGTAMVVEEKVCVFHDGEMTVVEDESDPFYELGSFELAGTSFAVIFGDLEEFADDAISEDCVINLVDATYDIQRGDIVSGDKTAADQAFARDNGVWIVRSCCVGAADQAVYPGGSCAITPAGELVTDILLFDEAVLVLDIDGGEEPTWDASLEEVEERDFGFSMRMDESGIDDEAADWGAICAGTRGYIVKNGFTDVVIGLSGGLDSTIVAAIAVDALGPERVHGVLMPSEYSSQGSIDDSLDLAERLGIDTLTLPITEPFQAFQNVLAEPCGGAVEGLTRENLQARIRTVYIMALSNQYGWVMLNTGNKSEAAMGYSTLYGDTCGAYAPVGNVYKTRLYELAAWRNEQSEVIPPNVLTKAPSAELRPDQTDQDSLPPYEILDGICNLYLEYDYSADMIVEEGFEPETVERVLGLLVRNEYKRANEPIGPWIDGVSMSDDRRWPITNAYRERVGE